MRSLFPADRAAEEFALVLEGRGTQSATDRHSDLLDTVAALLAHPQALPRSDFVSDLRSRLLIAAQTELVAAPGVVRHLPASRRSRHPRRIGTVAASLVLVGSTAGLAAAASGSLPGDGLYPLKRGVEQAITAARLGDAATGRSLLDQADSRLAEVRSLQAQGSPDSALIAATVTSFRESAEAGADRLFEAYRVTGDAETISSVRTFAAAQMTRIAAMTGTSATTDATLVDAADTLTDIDERARGLCGSCPPNATLTPPDTLSAGAAAATVDRLLVRPVAQAQVDLTAAGAAEVARLKIAAERSAGKIGPPRSGAQAGTDSIGAEDPPVTSTLTPKGSLVPNTNSGVAVTDLVSGVTSSLEEVGSTTPPVTAPADSLIDSADKAADDLLP